MLEWKIRKCGYGGYVADKVGIPQKGIEAGYCPGVIIGATLYESRHFDTFKQAEKFVKQRQQKGR